ncbi:hypothetical protein OSTOST_08523 [Ostertagia ostertagi]
MIRHWASVLYPLDMIRHRLQMNGFERRGFGKTSDYRIGMIRTMLMVVRNESVYGLFKGLWPSQLKAAANSGCAFLFYELFCDLLRANKDNSWLVSAQALCFTVSKLVFGVASDRVSSVRIISFGFVSSFHQILLSVVCIGCFQGAAWVPATKLVGKWYTDHSYAKMFSILGCGSTVAGFFTLLFSACFYYTLRGDDIKPQHIEKESSLSLISLTYSPVIWSVAAMYLFSMEVRTICETWIPLYVAENGLSLATFQVTYEIGGCRLLSVCRSDMLLHHQILRIFFLLDQVLAGSPLAFLIDKFGYDCFLPFFFSHIAVLIAITSMDFGFHVKGKKQD